MTTKQTSSTPKKRGRPKKVWTKARREARSKAMKKMWRDAPQEKKDKMLSCLTARPACDWDHERRVQIQSKVDQKTKAAKMSATRKKRIAEGKITMDAINEGRKKWWDNLSPQQRQEYTEERLARLAKWRSVKEDKREQVVYESGSYKTEQKRLYDIAVRILNEYGTKPKRSQGIGYYQRIIEYFAPELVDWK